MHPNEKRIRQRLRGDFPYYAKKCLKIRPKVGGVVPFELNQAQRYLHEQLETQLRETGMVRAIVLKGRQQGCSTYIAGRFYHRVTHLFGVLAFILTHLAMATANLFRIVEHYHDNVSEIVRPETGKSNTKELAFSALNSGYKVGTAGSEGVGRSETIQFFHGSEVAFWDKAEGHLSGIMEAVPNAPGTEVVLESTAKGMGNVFHTYWVNAVAGLNGFLPIFIPWFWQDEYRIEGAEYEPEDLADAEYMELHGLTAEQMAWRAQKISRLGSKERFMEEYPATPDEAFQTTGHDPYILPHTILKARKNILEPQRGPIVAALDPARSPTGDRTAFIMRQNRKAWGLEYRQGWDVYEVSQWAARKLEDKTLKIAMLFVDIGGLGAGVYDNLVHWGYGSRVTAVNFGGKAYDDEKYANRRSEMYADANSWLKDTAGAQIPDDNSLHADLSAPGFTYDKRNRLLLEPKEKIKERGLPSPDGADALVMTFAEPVGWDNIPAGAEEEPARRVL